MRSRKRSEKMTHSLTAQTVAVYARSLKALFQLLSALFVAVIIHQADVTLAQNTSGAEIFDDTRGDTTIDQDTLDEAEVAFFEGLTAYRAKRYQEAAKLFKKAHSLVPFRDLLFNVARAYEEMKDKANAIKYYKQYLDTKPIDETQMIRRLRQLGVKDFRKSQQSNAPSPKVANPGMLPPSSLDSGGSRGIMTWSAVGGGALLIGLGAYFGVDALSQAEEARETTSAKNYRDFKDGAESSALLADISISLGVIAVAGGLYLLLSESPQSMSGAQGGLGVTSSTTTPAAPLRWSVQVDEHSTSLGLSGSF